MTRKLAIDGGKPVRSQYLPYARQSILEEDISAVVKVLRSDWLTTGPAVDAFERAVALETGAAFAVSFSSGTAALHAAAFASGLGPGDEAITCPFTFAATANCILYMGATPVFADVCEDTLTLDPAQVERKITSRTRAILPVDYAGHPADLDEIREIARKHSLTVIEDGAHALGARYREKSIGSINDMTMFSFHPVKHITTGEGGIITTSDQSFEKLLRAFRNHGLDTDARQRQEKGSWYYEMTFLGFNYRLTDLACALGESQLRRLSSNLARRRELAAFYSSTLGAVPGIRTPSVRPYADPAWHLYPIRLDLARFRVDRGQFFRALRAENIGVNVHYIPVHLHPYYRDRFGYVPGQYPVSEAAYESLISLPMFHTMTNEDAADVVESIRKVAEAYTR